MWAASLVPWGGEQLRACAGGRGKRPHDAVTVRDGCTTSNLDDTTSTMPRE